MDEINILENTFGGRWCGIRFDPDGEGGKKQEHHALHFCRAIAEPHRWPITFSREKMDCPGGRYSLGWYEEKSLFLERFAGKSGLNRDKAEDVLNHTAHLNGDFNHVIVGTRNTPDVWISFAQPDIVMKIIQKWQRLFGGQVLIETSGYMSICSSIAVKAFLTNRICISFGCSESRIHTGIGRDRLIIGLSQRLMEYFHS